ncbi:MAG: SIR2 family protein [Prevotellaceae bacterium]|nr:SIR2 family protein [Prevotellaceae bacterium]
MSYYSSGKMSRDFESQVLDFIQSQLSDNEKAEYEKALSEQKENRRLYFYPDMVLPIGCEKLKWEKYTIVEVKTYLRFNTIQWLKNRIGASGLDDYEVKIIYLSSLCVNLPETEDTHYQILSKDELFGRIPGDNQKGSTGSYNEKDVVDYRIAFQERTCTLFVGAGVSQSAGLSGWQELLQRITKRIIGPEEYKDDSYFKTVEEICSHSNIVTARYLEKLLTAKRLRAKRNLREREKPRIKEGFVRYLREAMYDGRKAGDMNLVNSIVDLVRNNRDKIQSVITYNFDDLLEQEFEKQEVKAGSFFDNSGIVEKGVFPVIHVHGILPQTSGQGGEIIFSEDEYHELYNNQNSWANVVQLYALQTTTCFFLGMSMNDPNLRRLLEVSKHSDEVMHYAFLRKEDALKSFDFAEKEEVIKSMFRDLGVEIVWFNVFGELPRLIREMGVHSAETADSSTD